MEESAVDLIVPENNIQIGLKYYGPGYNVSNKPSDIPD